MSSMPQDNISRLEFYGMMLAVFSFLFVVQASKEISFPGFQEYVKVLIVVVQLICLYQFFKYWKHKKQ